MAVAAGQCIVMDNQPFAGASNYLPALAAMKPGGAFCQG